MGMAIIPREDMPLDLTQPICYASSLGKDCPILYKETTTHFLNQCGTRQLLKRQGGEEKANIHVVRTY